MAKTKTNEKDDNNLSSDGNINITPEIAKSIDDLIFQQKNIERDQEALKEAMSQIAEKLGIKPGELKGRIGIIIKEEEQGGAIQSKTQQIDFVEQYFTVKTNNEFKK